MINFYKKHKEIIDYIFFGIVTTVVSFIAYKITTIALVGFDSMNDGNGNANELLVSIATGIQWVVGVMVAFVTNKIFVFKDKNNDIASVAKQLGVFAGSRVFTGLLDWGITLGGAWLFVKIGIGVQQQAEYANIIEKLWNKLFTADFIAKCIAAVFVIITNYIISKLLVFRKKKSGQTDNEDAIK